MRMFMIEYGAFTPMSAMSGGLMIGAAALILMAFLGRIMGVSGILGSALTFNMSTTQWQWGFLGGTVLGAFGVSLMRPSVTDITVSTSWIVLIIAGLIVGYGTRLGSGCTSGHGVCGIGRLSARSIVATGVFMASAAVTVFVGRHVLAII